MLFSTSRHNQQSAIAIGKFDGLHIGHRKLIKTLITQAKNQGLIAHILLIEPHPIDYFTKQQHPRLMSLRTKIQALLRLEVDQVTVMPFKQISNLTAKAFISDFLIDIFKCKHIVVGTNFRFGEKQKGDIFLLQSLKSHFVTQALDINMMEGHIVSSSLIKKLIAEHDITKANQLLGGAYALSGKVVAGQKIGRQIGFPTANINTKIHLPLSGVYYGFATTTPNSHLPAVISVGMNPTLKTSLKKTAEVHIINNNNHELYNQFISFTPLGFIRSEKKYKNKNELIEAINNDVNHAKQKLKKHKSNQIKQSLFIHNQQT